MFFSHFPSGRSDSAFGLETRGNLRGYMGLVVEMIGRRTVNPILICTEPKESMTSIVCVHLHVVPMHGDALIG